MIFTDLLARLKLEPRDAEVIFDRDEPIGRPTDLVMPARRWFRRRHHKAGDALANRGATRDALNHGAGEQSRSTRFPQQ
jgi:hypothetical protein